MKSVYRESWNDLIKLYTLYELQKYIGNYYSYLNLCKEFSISEMNREIHTYFEIKN